MTFGIGNLVALICIVISIIFAIATHQATNALCGHCSRSLPCFCRTLPFEQARAATSASIWRIAARYRRHNTRLTAATVSARATNTPPSQP